MMDKMAELKELYEVAKREAQVTVALAILNDIVAYETSQNQEKTLQPTG